MIATLPLRPTVNNGTILPKKGSGTLPSPSGSGSRKDTSTSANKRWGNTMWWDFYVYRLLSSMEVTDVLGNFCLVSKQLEGVDKVNRLCGVSLLSPRASLVLYKSTQVSYRIFKLWDPVFLVLFFSPGISFVPIPFFSPVCTNSDHFCHKLSHFCLVIIQKPLTFTRADTAFSPSRYLCCVREFVRAHGAQVINLLCQGNNKPFPHLWRTLP